MILTPHKKIKTIESTSKIIENLDLPDATILLVEDNKINQEIILGLLENSPIKIDIANNGKEAIELFNSNIHEIILMDIKMPIMDGFEASKILRNQNQKTPIIALTANVMNEDIQHTKQIGMNEHLEKPIDLKKLHYVLNKYLKKEPIKIKIEDLNSINSVLGLNYINGNRNLYLKIINDFYQNYKNLNLQLENDEQKEIIIHTLKGLSLNIGAERLYKSIQEFENIKNINQISEIQIQISTIINELKNIDLETIIKSISQLSLSKIQREQIFTELYEIIKQKKPKRCHEIIEKIEVYKLDLKDKIVFDKVKREIEKYNFIQANIFLKEIF